jgi:NAD+ synthase
MLPYKNSHPDSQADAEAFARQLGIGWQVVDITPMTDAYFDTYQPDANSLRRGNWMARTRMCVLYDHSAKLKALVMGTSNRTELLVGYFTQYGDSACALEPIGHLYKSEVWALATRLDIPDRIIRKTPTADLWHGQTDEDELGMSYRQLDDILYALTELDLDVQSSEGLLYPKEAYLKVERMVDRSSFKRNPPPIPES